MLFISFKCIEFGRSRGLIVLTALLIGAQFAVSLKAAESATGSGEYQRLLGQLNSLEARVDETTDRLQALVNSKGASRDVKEKETLIQQMVGEHEALREQVAEYNRLRNEIRFRFPAQGEAIDLLFGPRRPPSVQELEQRSSLDASLDRVQATFLRHYGSLLRGADGNKGEGAEGHQRGPASDTEPEKSRPRLKLSR